MDQVRRGGDGGKAEKEPEPGPKEKVQSGDLGIIRTGGDKGQTESRGGSNRKEEQIQDGRDVKTSRIQGAVRCEKLRA